MSNKIEKALLINLADELELSIPETLEQEEVLQIISSRIAELMEEGRMEFLLHLMYRHDVKEQDILNVLNPKTMGMPNEMIASLLIERFKKKQETRLQYKTPPVKDWLKF